MKSIIKFAFLTAVMTGSSQAATTTIAAGLGGSSVQGVSLETSSDHLNLVASTDYYVGVGRWDSGTTTFTLWGGTNLALDTGAVGTPTREVSGVFTTSAGGSFDGLGVQVFVGLLSTVANSAAASFTPGGTQWVVLSSSGNPLFAASSGSANSTFNMTTPATLTFVATGSASNVFNGTSSVSGSATNYLLLPAAVPEPSAALLGMLGALGLLRRRR